MPRQTIRISFEAHDAAPEPEPLFERACEYLASPDTLTALFIWGSIGVALAATLNWMMA